MRPFQEVQLVSTHPCEKCMAYTIRRLRYVGRVLFIREYMRWECERCGHALISQCADAKEKA